MKVVRKNTVLETDKAYLEGLLSNTDVTLSKLYEQYFPSIQQMILSNSGDEEEAKDIFQETLIVLYNKVSAGNFELTSQLKTFLYAVARRLWLRRLQELGKKDVNYNLDQKQSVDIEADLEHHQAQEKQFLIMEVSLEQIGEPCKTILEDFYLRGMSMQEISDKFGYTNAENAKNQKYKCLQRLKKIFFTSN